MHRFFRHDRHHLSPLTGPPNSGSSRGVRKILHLVRISSDHDQPRRRRQLKKLPIFWPIAAFLGGRSDLIRLLGGGNSCLGLPCFCAKPANPAQLHGSFFPGGRRLRIPDSRTQYSFPPACRRPLASMATFTRITKQANPVRHQKILSRFEDTKCHAKTTSLRESKDSLTLRQKIARWHLPAGNTICG